VPPAETNLVTSTSSARVAWAWVLVAVWAGVVWWLGTDQFSAGEGSRWLGWLFRLLLPNAAAADLWQDYMLSRKAAHVFVYGVLAALSFRAALLSGVPGLLRGAAIALAIAVSLAGLDEYRQSFSAVRTGVATDVLIDAAGASVALALLAAMRRRTRPSVVG
jgi:VanZ family protein